MGLIMMSLLAWDVGRGGMGCRHGPDHDESVGMGCGHEFDDMGLIMMSLMAWDVG